MSFFQTILLITLSANLLWWAFAHVVARQLANPLRWRLFTAAFMVAQVLILLWILASRRWPDALPAIPLPLRAIGYIWNLVISPLALIIALVGSLALTVSWLMIRSQTHTAATSTPPAGSPDAAATVPGSAISTTPHALREHAQPEPTFSRRALIASALATPPALTGLALIKSLADLDHIRVREITIPIANLHPSLDGLTIAHVTDTHVGRYTTGPILRTIAEKTNALRCDLVAFTGDLIDASHADLPDALDMLKRFDAPTYLCEGNHDLFEGRDNFERILRAGGVNLLTNESALVRLRGAPVQLLGIRWGSAFTSRRDATVPENVRAVAALRAPEAFPILLAHHPHAFDFAAEQNLPLTLAGHTHGGQLMLSDNLGAGPALYRYWSGRYSQLSANGQPAHAVIGNGTGNWFPLRLNAPAEIVKITLKRA